MFPCVKSERAPIDAAFSHSHMPWYWVLLTRDEQLSTSPPQELQSKVWSPLSLLLSQLGEPCVFSCFSQGITSSHFNSFSALLLHTFKDLHSLVKFGGQEVHRVLKMKLQQC